MPVTNIINNELLGAINMINMIPSHVIESLVTNPGLVDKLMIEYVDQPVDKLIDVFFNSLPRSENRTLTPQQVHRYAQQVLERNS